jgi:protein O-GlcNAc transferase
MKKEQHLHSLLSLLANQRHNDLEKLARTFVSSDNQYRAEVHRILAHSRFVRGHVEEAQSALTQALALRPDDHAIRRELASCRYAAGAVDGALALLQQCLAANPGDVEALAKLAEIHYAISRYEDALLFSRRALAVEPNMPDAVIVGLRAARAVGDDHTVMEVGRSVLDHGDDIAAWLSDVAMEVLGVDAALAEGLLRRAVTLEPHSAGVLLNLGYVLFQKQAFDESAAIHEKAMSLAPAAAEIRNSYGNLLLAKGDYEGAFRRYREAIKLDPSLAAAYGNLGGALRELGRLDEALVMVREAVRIDPNYADGYGHLGAILVCQGRLLEAEMAFRQLRALAPGDSKVRDDMVGVLFSTGRHGEAAALLQEWGRGGGNPGAGRSLGSQLFGSNYLSATTAEGYLQDALRFGQSVSTGECWRRQDVESAPEKMLRLGFVSADLRGHPVGRLLSSVLPKIGKDGFRVFLYANHPAHGDDALTRELQADKVVFRRIHGMSDHDVADQIVKDRVDVLIDLSGHTAGNRLEVFALKPAPVQISWMGYFASTGLAQMDHFVGDPYMLPASEWGHFCETPIILPHSYYCYSLPLAAPDVGSPPALDTGYVTFGCFNNRAKITDAVLRCWAQIIAAVPGSRLLVKTKELSGIPEQDLFRQQFSTCGGDPQCLMLEGASSYNEYLASFNRVDIALDPYPYPGGLTSLDGLWMGVPVLTLKGNRFIGHQGEMIMHNLGLPEWVADDEMDYIEKAVALSGERELLARLRQELRERMRCSPLCRPDVFATNFGCAVRTVWQDWCQSVASTHSA